jgi:DNA-directed RNA polymerase specialized sigma24 family protein
VRHKHHGEPVIWPAFITRGPDNSGSRRSNASISGARLEMRGLDFALQRLPVEQRRVLLLVGLGELGYTDVALAVDIPIGTSCHVHLVDVNACVH